MIARSITIVIVLCAIGCGERDAAPAPVAPSAPSDPRCISLCEHSAACLDARGIARTDAEDDCAGSCRPGGLYAAMPEDVLACAPHHDCAALDACTGAALDTVLGVDDPQRPHPEEHSVLRSWPEGLPSIPGGMPLPVRDGDPLTIARVAYPSTPEGMESLLRAELERAGWQADPTIVEENALRFFVRRGDTELGVSIYADQPGRSVLQVFAFGDSRP
ncbi:hypothetical protein [Sandaracinus amylolyticus]|uniref:hypothetical protein n=1 Tax=Sandaracinus amylolyticus TaxID=927083 RepID=UPI001F2813E9|nr:hypothetical protein [Sandaracinus amylolyticus]UJR86898.1 Hypothetical protein I5071_89990 [Sandaracinus amylolyticus]